MQYCYEVVATFAKEELGFDQAFLETICICIAQSELFNIFSQGIVKA